MRQLQPFRQRLGEQCCLVIPPLPFSLAMQRDPNHHVRGQGSSFSAHQFGQPLCKPRPQRLDLLEFQQQNRTHYRSFIYRKAASPRKGVGSILTSRTEQLSLRLMRQSGETPPANLAYVIGHPLTRREALFAIVKSALSR